MDRLTLRLELAKQAWTTLDAALRLEQPSNLERDGAIQRFEYTFEAFWKAAQLYLEIGEGIIARSPRTVLRGLGQTGILSEEETVQALSMLEDRNLTVHTYVEEVARLIYSRLPGHRDLLGAALARMETALVS
ncbi:MAG: nucleotidyltransferase substrate binding protein [Actinobacteria bacterium]|nr:nucleotidyltransferase substrate binding protein [Actinomycetota bacterium]